eukprot:scaffold10065_cov111-Isochrysis_galbana.AAC.5
MAKRMRSAHGLARSTSYMPFDERLHSSARCAVYMRPCRELPCTVSATADASTSTRVRVCTLCVRGAWRTHVWRPLWHPWPAANGYTTIARCASMSYLPFQRAAYANTYHWLHAGRRRCGGATAGLAIEA